MIFLSTNENHLKEEARSGFISMKEARTGRPHVSGLLQARPEAI